MGNIVTFAAVNTKVKALSRKLLTREQFVKLIECTSYLEALKYLSEETVYAEVLSSYNLDELKRDKLEVILRRAYIKNFHKLTHYLTGNYKKLFKTFYLRFQIEDLKIILRGKYAGKPKAEFNGFIAEESYLNQLNYEELISSADIDEVIEKLQNTKYYRYIAPFSGVIKGEGLFRIEMALDFMYFSSLRKLKKMLSKDDGAAIRKINGTYADLLNLQWIYRGKRFYKLPPEELMNYTIYDWFKIDRDTIKTLCYSKDIEEFYNLIESLPYNAVFNRSKKEEYLIEKEILAYIKRMHSSFEKRNQLDVSVVVSYLELSLMEIRDITSIMESKLYNSSGEDIFKYVTITH